MNPGPLGPILKTESRLTNPVMVGQFVYHCRVLEYEDPGMMANIVVPPR